MKVGNVRRSRSFTAEDKLGPAHPVPEKVPVPETVRVEFHPAAGVDLLSLQGHVDVGHLDGVTGSSSLEWFVSAPETSQQVLCEIRVLGGTGGNVCRKVSRPS